MLKYNELIEGNYYHIKAKMKDTEWYFRFRCYEDNGIYATNFYIFIKNGIETHRYITNNSDYVLIANNVVNDFLYYDIGFDIVKQYLPKGHPDIIEHRKINIKKLLFL